MSKRSFEFAEDISTKTLVPVHWDLFEVNSVHQLKLKLYMSQIENGNLN